MNRRNFFKTSLVASSVLLSSSAFASTTTKPTDGRKVAEIAFPEKKPLITYSNRPPLLESPRSVFTQTITPNDEFFVRWHLPEIPTHLDPNRYTIKINGLVSKPLEITVKELKEKFEPVEITAVLQCGGNSRSAFHPTVGGIQWGSGAMGCAKWKGVRLKDVLKYAGISEDAHWVGFNGKDNPAYYEAPDFIRELEMEEITDDVILAYEMNGEDMPYLNGFPVRLVVPGYYSDSWVKMLDNITVTNKYKSYFYMDKGYRIPDNATESETPEHHFKPTKPITFMNVKSFIGYPEDGTKIAQNSHVVVRGVAFDSGRGIAKVQISTDNGKTWEDAILDDGSAGKFAYRGFRFAYKPTKKGNIKIMAKATDIDGNEQPLPDEVLYNHGGYKYNGIDSVTIKVI